MDNEECDGQSQRYEADSKEATILDRTGWIWELEGSTLTMSSPYIPSGFRDLGFRGVGETTQIGSPFTKGLSYRLNASGVGSKPSSKHLTPNGAKSTLYVLKPAPWSLRFGYILLGSNPPGLEPVRVRVRFFLSERRAARTSTENGS